ncbi:uncharacterized protein LOC119771190 [Culex quinquefasciatus]|uniref:uncharacterized protein LOC119771190 n=1 Tax=Culex quinquefasciatus TaxID=7176 RepID=UPI0018E3A266|nr:uncharacterized protein LOC119771190 [Culex quinquefasciatus]
MTLPRTPKSNKKKKKNSTPKKEVSEEESGNGDAKKEEVTPIYKQLLVQRMKEDARKMEEQLKALVRQRDAAERRLKRVQADIKTSAAAPNENLRNVHFLRHQLSNVESAFSKFGEYQDKIYAMALAVEEQAKHEKCELEIEALRRGLTLKLKDLVEELEKPGLSAALVPAATPQYLPPLNVPLPKFDGTYETWLSFKSMFQHVMARYTAEAPAIKLYHLRDSLVGKAAGVIDQDIVNNNDYEAAWAVLEDLYGDKRAIIDRHIDVVFALPKISRDNAAELRKLIDTCVKHVEGLKSLQLPVNGLGEQMLLNLLASRMDLDTRKAWEAEQKVGVLPTYPATIAFLKERCRVLERLEPHGEKSVKPQRSVALVVARGAKCYVCNQQHETKNCEQIQQRSVNERYSQLRRYGLCFNCMKKGHRAGECTSTNSCQRCSKRHHTMLHKDGAWMSETSPATTALDAPNPNDELRWQSGRSETSSVAAKKSTLLSTAVVQVYGGDGVPHLCRTLIDSCSENHFMTERFANLLAVKKERANCEVSGLNGGCTRISHSVRATMKSRVTSFSRKLELLITPKIVEDAPLRTIDVANWNLPSNIKLADSTFNKTGPVDMLLGAGVFWDLLKAGRIALADGLPSLRETELGWVVGGALPIGTPATTRSFCGVVKKV